MREDRALPRRLTAGVGFGRELQRRSRCVRPVHGAVFHAAGTGVRRLRRRGQGPAGARCRLRPGCVDNRVGHAAGASDICAIDPSQPFVEAIRERLPAVTVRQAPAEEIPFEVGAFDATVAQLVVHFMTDPVAGLREMARVTRNGGVIAACVWDHAGGKGPLSLFWSVAHDLDPEATTESGLAGAREGHLAQLFLDAGLTRSRTGLCRSPPSIRASKNGGSRTRSESAPSAAMSTVSVKRIAISCANRVATVCRTHPSS